MPNNTKSTKYKNSIFSLPMFVIFLSIISVLIISTACLSTSSSSSYSSNQREESGNSINTLSASGPPVNLSGTGRTATSQMSLPSPFSKVTFKHNGSSNFIVSVYYGNEEDLLVNEIGNYSGTTLIVSNENVMFDIDADGSWTGKIEGVGKSSSASFSGNGDNVSGFFTPPSQGAWEITHNGDSNFVVWFHCVGGSDLVVNEIGVFSGSTIINFEQGPCLWEINANGSWSIKPR